jgi:hypothetical protein
MSIAALSGLAAPTSTGCEGDKIVNEQGETIILKGAGLGGHLNMECVACCSLPSPDGARPPG